MDGQGDYNLIANNCNDFSDALCKAACGKGLPGWVNRMANCAGCLTPKKMLFAGVIPEDVADTRHHHHERGAAGAGVTNGQRQRQQPRRPLSKERKSLTAQQLALLAKLRETRQQAKNTSKRRSATGSRGMRKAD